jgi:hypothetical protein
VSTLALGRPGSTSASRAAASSLAIGPVAAIVVVSVAVLLLTAGAYGLHRDELYFIVAGRHLDWGYVDQPPLTPLLTAWSATVFGVSAAGIRVLPALVYGAFIVLTAAIAREFGGTRRAQALAAVTIAISGCLAAGHLSSTATYDLLGWLVVLWLTIRLLRGADPRLWLVAGVAAGVTLENKNLVLFLGAGLAGGLLVARRWDILRSPWLWAAGVVAFVMWLPNLAWQAAHGWPQIEMAKAIASRSGDENRTLLLPMQLLFSGPLLFPIAIAGLIWLLHSRAALAWRPVGWAYIGVLALLFLTSGKSYYAGGLLPVLVAAGATVLDRWLERGRRRVRWSTFGSLAVASGLIAAVLALPLVPVSSVGSTPIPDINSDIGNTVGWPALVGTVDQVVQQLTPEERARAAIFTNNYGEAGALELLGPSDLPPVYSGHNSYATWGPPPENLTLTIVVATWPGAGSYFAQWFGPCARAATIDNGVGVASEEQGAGVWVCDGRTAPWSRIWPELAHIS